MIEEIVVECPVLYAETIPFPEDFFSRLPKLRVFHIPAIEPITSYRWSMDGASVAAALLKDNAGRHLRRLSLPSVNQAWRVFDVLEHLPSLRHLELSFGPRQRQRRVALNLDDTTIILANYHDDDPNKSNTIHVSSSSPATLHGNMQTVPESE